jgi:hypothetical protein
MAAEYVVAGRRALPGLFRLRAWCWVFELEQPDDEEDDESRFEDGACEVSEIPARGNADYHAYVAAHVGFAPKSVVTIRKAGWEFSRAAAEVLAGALDGATFVDTDPERVYAVAATAPARSLEELKARIVVAAGEAAAFFERWAAEEARAQEEDDRLHPEDAELRRREDDWSDV